MQRFILLTLVALLAFVFFHSQASAQAQSPSTAFEQKTYVYEPWIKGKFSEVVTVKNPGKWIFLAGIGPESEGDGKILYPGDFYRQCKYAYYRIKKLLAMHGATLKNVVFVTTYMMDIRHIGASGKCRTEEFAEAGAELPPGASVGVNALATKPEPTGSTTLTNTSRMRRVPGVTARRLPFARITSGARSTRSNAPFRARSPSPAAQGGV